MSRQHKAAKKNYRENAAMIKDCCLTSCDRPVRNRSNIRSNPRCRATNGRSNNYGALSLVKFFVVSLKPHHQRRN